MSTDGTKSLREYVKEHEDKDPQALLNLVIAESERARAAADRELNEQKSLSEVAWVDGKGLRPSNMAGIWRMARMFSASQMVPTQFRDKPYDCWIVIQMALRCGVDPFAFMQKCYIVHGRPGIEAQLAIAMANTSGKLKGRVTYELTGNEHERQCTAIATLADSGEVVRETVSVKIAKSMGWWNKEGSLWPKMTDLMLRYRSAMWLLRAYLPEVLMGIYSVDELADSGPGKLPDEIGADVLAQMIAAAEAVPMPTKETPSAPAQDTKADELARKLEEKRAAAAEHKADPKPEPPKPAEEKPKKAAATKTKAPKPEKAPEEPVQQSIEDEAAVPEDSQEETQESASEPNTTPSAPLPDDRPWTEDEVVKALSAFKKHLQEAADYDEADAHFFFDIEERKHRFLPQHYAWAQKELDKKKAAIIKEEKERSASAGKKPATSQQSMLNEE